MRRARLLLLPVLLVAGCLGTPVDAPAAEVDDPAAPTPDEAAGGDAGATAPPPTVGEAGPLVTERFLFTADHALAVAQAGAASGEAQRVREPLAPTAFYSGLAQGVDIAPWLSEPFSVPWEATGEIAVTLSFVADEPAVSATKPAQFPPVGGWVGAEGRYAAFFGVADAPDALEAGRVYTLTARVPMPAGGLFLREGERLAVYTFLAYQTASGGAPSYVVGGDAPSMLELPHRHFDVAAPAATVLVEEAGAFDPHPGVTSEGDPSTARVAFTVPPGAAFVVAELVAAAGPSGRIDADLHLEGGAGVAGSGTGPGAREVVVLGPHALAQGRDLAARVQSASASGGTWTLKVTAYGP